MLPKINPIGLPEWQALKDHYQKTHVQLRQSFLNDANRFRKFSIEMPDFLYDFSKNLINENTINLLVNLVKACKLDDAIEAYFAGEMINETEKRAVFHTALRSSDPRYTVTQGREMYASIQGVLDKMGDFSRRVISGVYKGYTGKRITDIVNIGIGGSDLGPKMAAMALSGYSTGLNVHFVSNVDYSHIDSVLKKIQPDQTLFIIASKTFTTQETMTNAVTAKEWFLEKMKEQDAVSHHFIAVSCQSDEVKRFGISEEHRFEFWDWVGGRFSLWSSIGLSLMLRIGPENFEQMLRGAENMDVHFRERPFSENVPVIMGMLGIWYRNFHHSATHAVLPYCQNLDLLPDYLQQVDMESNGKSTDRNGRFTSYATGGVIWGRAGTNGQHAFYQMIHQGKDLIPIDFIGFVNGVDTNQNHHPKLMANLFAQSEALAFGKTVAELEHEHTSPDLIPHQFFEGNKPSSTFLFQELSPYTLGQLIALYEHKIFVQGVVWNIYSYDQFGVELGKKMASTILNEIKNGAVGQHDASTNGLLNYFLQRKK